MKHYTFARDEREAIDRLVSAAHDAMQDVFDDPNGMNGGDPFEDDDKNRILQAVTLAIRQTCKSFGYGIQDEPSGLSPDLARRLHDLNFKAECEREQALLRLT